MALFTVRIELSLKSRNIIPTNTDIHVYINVGIIYACISMCSMCMYEHRCTHVQTCECLPTSLHVCLYTSTHAYICNMYLYIQI